MDLSTIPDDAIKTHGVQRQLFDRVFAVAQSAQAPAQAVQEARCACNDRPASGCPGEWEPGCDLGSNPKYVRVGQSPAQAPVVQAVQAVELIEQEMAMLIRRLCSTTANDKTRAQAMEYLFKRGHASPLRAESAPAQAMDHPPLPEGVKARFKCEDCDGTGYTGEMIPGSEFQPPEPVGCTSCRFTGWWAECEAYSADQMHAYLDADRASSGAAQAVRMLTQEELEHCRLWYDGALNQQLGVLRKFCEVNAGRTIPADGKIGSAA
jgi:hypothetical protein